MQDSLSWRDSGASGWSRTADGRRPARRTWVRWAARSGGRGPAVEHLDATAGLPPVPIDGGHVAGEQVLFVAPQVEVGLHAAAAQQLGPALLSHPVLGVGSAGAEPADVGVGELLWQCAWVNLAGEAVLVVDPRADRAQRHRMHGDHGLDRADKLQRQAVGVVAVVAIADRGDDQGL